MKKTLVAVAAMAAVTGAMADATISGVLDQAYYTSKITGSTGSTTTYKGVGSQNNGTSEFTISGSDDIGNGMKAMYAFNVQADIGSGATAANSAPALTTGTNNGMAMRRSFVGLSGDFGSVKLGNQWTPAFFVGLAADPTALVSSTGAGVVAASKSIGASANSITYNLPTVFPGLAVSLQSGQGEAGNSSGGNNSGGSVTYSNGGLMAAYAWQKATASTGDTFTTSAGAATTIVTSLATLTSSSKIASTMTTVTYDLGVVKLYANSNSDKVTGTTSKISGSIYGVSIPVGAATTIGIVSSSTNGTGLATTKEKGSRYAVFHNLSKRTQAYAFTGKSSLSGYTTGHAMTAFGLQTAF